MLMRALLLGGAGRNMEEKNHGRWVAARRREQII